MLQTNEYVAILPVDYSKAFDTVSHNSLMLKMCTIDLPDQIHNWVVNNFIQRGQITSHRGIMSSLAMIMPVSFRVRCWVLDPLLLRHLIFGLGTVRPRTICPPTIRSRTIRPFIVKEIL